MNQQSAVTDHLSVLSDAIRVRVLAVLEGRELTVSELCDVIQLPQSTVSRQLKTLLDGGWVSSRPDGTRRLYSLPLADMDSAAKRLWYVVREQVTDSAAAGDDARRLKQVLAARRRNSESFFSSAAGQWSRLREELFGSTSHLRALLGLLDSSLVIGDLGCGTGNVAAWLAPFAGRVIGVDASKEMLKSARRHLSAEPNVELRHGSLEKLPVENRELDAAVMMLVLHHLPEPVRAIAEAARVLKPGGRLLILDMLPHEREEYRQTMGHVWLGFSEKQMSQWLQPAGFESVRWSALPARIRGEGAVFICRQRTTNISFNQRRSECQQ